MEYIDRHEEAAKREAERREKLGPNGRNAENARHEAELLESKAEFNAAQQRLSQLPPNEKAAAYAKAQRIRNKIDQEREERRLEREQQAIINKKIREGEKKAMADSEIEHAKEVARVRREEKMMALNVSNDEKKRRIDFLKNAARRRDERLAREAAMLTQTSSGGRRKSCTLRKHKRTLRKHKRRTHKRTHRRTHKH
jgi:hypothetical protein